MECKQVTEELKWVSVKDEAVQSSATAVKL